MNNIYEKYGLKKVINASGRMTKLGASTVSEPVIQIMSSAMQNYVEMDHLLKYAGKEVAKMTGAEDACITSCASAGIVLSIASLITGDNLNLIHHFYENLPKVKKREIIIPAGHMVNYGAPISEMIRMGGGIPIEAGFANGTTEADVKSVMNENTLAIMYVKSHHCVQKNMLSVNSVIRIAKEANLPCILDVAAEEDLTSYARTGADFICYSGTKAICGPTSGFVLCNSQKNAECMRMQYEGVARPMKIGKEGIVGLLSSVNMYLQNKNKGNNISHEDLLNFCTNVTRIPGCSAVIENDEAGRKIERCAITFDQDQFGMSAIQAAERLLQNEVSIYLRDYNKNLGVLAVDPRPLKEKDELEEIEHTIMKLYREKQNE